MQHVSLLVAIYLVVHCKANKSSYKALQCKKSETFWSTLALKALLKQSMLFTDELFKFALLLF